MKKLLMLILVLLLCLNSLAVWADLPAAGDVFIPWAGKPYEELPQSHSSQYLQSIGAAMSPDEEDPDVQAMAFNVKLQKLPEGCVGCALVYAAWSEAEPLGLLAVSILDELDENGTDLEFFVYDYVGLLKTQGAKDFRKEHEGCELVACYFLDENNKVIAYEVLTPTGLEPLDDPEEPEPPEEEPKTVEVKVKAHPDNAMLEVPEFTLEVTVDQNHKVKEADLDAALAKTKYGQIEKNGKTYVKDAWYVQKPAPTPRSLMLRPVLLSALGPNPLLDKFDFEKDQLTKDTVLFLKYKEKKIIINDPITVPTPPPVYYGQPQEKAAVLTQKALSLPPQTTEPETVQRTVKLPQTGEAANPLPLLLAAALLVLLLARRHMK